MSEEYEEVRSTTQVPAATGITGFLRVIEGLLKVPRLQELRIHGKGEVEYRYFLRAGEAEHSLDVDLSTVMPAGIIRNSALKEYDVVYNAAVALGELFEKVSRDGLYPVALVVGAGTDLWRWYTATTGIESARHEELHGVPVLVEPAYESHVLVLCASYTRTAALIDTQRCYKVVIPSPPKVPA